MLAIPTYYNGIVCRSRTEAQWAFVLDEQGIAYRYEPITFFFDLIAPAHWWFTNGYLPDFWLPAHRLWLEIKPHAPNAIEYEKAALLAECTGSGVLIATGGPSQSENTVFVTALDNSVIVSTLPDGSHPQGPFWRPRLYDPRHSSLGEGAEGLTWRASRGQRRVRSLHALLPSAW